MNEQTLRRARDAQRPIGEGEYKIGLVLFFAAIAAFFLWAAQQGPEKVDPATPSPPPVEVPEADWQDLPADPYG